MIDKLLLFPYYMALGIRKFCYDHQFLCRSREAEVPTVSLGNITAGGTGKTPHAEMILRTLQENPEWWERNIALLSCGYKRKSKGFQQVTVNRNASLFGDEPVQIKKKFPAVTVAVDKNRIRGCRNLCHPEIVRTTRAGRKCMEKDYPAADVIVLDDAFQYRRLKPSLSIVLVDYARPVSKDMLLPLGGLRDLKSRMADADIIIVSKCPAYLDDWERTLWANSLGIRGYSSSSFEGKNKMGRKQYLFFTGIEYGQPQPIYDECDTRYMYSPRMVLFTGIASDESLKRYLSDTYKIVDSFSFADHHRFSESDMRRIADTASHWATAALATTEKDAQRILASKNTPPSLRKRLFYIPIKVNFLTDEEERRFNELLFAAVKRS